MAFKIQNKTLNSIDSRVKHLNKALQTTNKNTEKSMNQTNVMKVQARELGVMCRGDNYKLKLASLKPE